MTDASDLVRAVQKLQRMIARAWDHAGSLPARDSVKVVPQDWHKIREMADALDLTVIDAALAQARREGIEAAAEVAYQWWDDDDAQELRDHIRALPDASPAPVTPAPQPSVAEAPAAHAYVGEDGECEEISWGPPDPELRDEPALVLLYRAPQMRRDYEAAGGGRTRTVDVAMLKRIRMALAGMLSEAIGGTASTREARIIDTELAAVIGGTHGE